MLSNEKSSSESEKRYAPMSPALGAEFRSLVKDGAVEPSQPQSDENLPEKTQDFGEKCLAVKQYLDRHNLPRGTMLTGILLRSPLSRLQDAKPK